MQQILTPEQFAKYQEIVAAHSKKRMGAGHKGQGHQK
jgi:Spy/CpxP family protein refolding chaperone